MRRRCFALWSLKVAPRKDPRAAMKNAWRVRPSYRYAEVRHRLASQSYRADLHWENVHQIAEWRDVIQSSVHLNTAITRQLRNYQSSFAIHFRPCSRDCQNQTYQRWGPSYGQSVIIGWSSTLYDIVHRGHSAPRNNVIYNFPWRGPPWCCCCTRPRTPSVSTLNLLRERAKIDWRETVKKKGLGASFSY